MVKTLYDALGKVLEHKGNLPIVDEFGDEISCMQVYNGKVILSTEKPVGKCPDCGGPLYLDNKTSFKYACPNENINKYIK